MSQLLVQGENDVSYSYLPSQAFSFFTLFSECSVHISSVLQYLFFRSFFFSFPLLFVRCWKAALLPQATHQFRGTVSSDYENNSERGSGSLLCYHDIKDFFLYHSWSIILSASSQYWENIQVVNYLAWSSCILIPHAVNLFASDIWLISGRGRRVYWLQGSIWNPPHLNFKIFL